MNLEVITDEGFLNNPYRSYRYIDPNDNRRFILAQEIYPRTRTSNAVALNGRYFLPYRAAVYGGYRFFTDTWDIRADTFELGYVHPIKQQWTLEARVRYYRQDNAEFYDDLFGRVNEQNFMGPRQGAVDLQQHGLPHRRELRVRPDRLALREEGLGEPVLRPHRVQVRRLP